MPSQQIIKSWSIYGAVAIIILGTVLHYFYPWFGEDRVLGAFVPVNESVWEHLKLGYWGLVLFSIPEYFKIKDKVNNYAVAKFLGILALEFSILGIFYTYTTFSQGPILWIDISSFVMGAIVCQLVAYRFYLASALPNKIQWAAGLSFLGIGILFIYLTYSTPLWPIFMDGQDFTYGIDKIKD
ncbi:MAG: DUF6512 family protein [Cecembia sp.]